MTLSLWRQSYTGFSFNMKETNLDVCGNINLVGHVIKFYKARRALRKMWSCDNQICNISELVFTLNVTNVINITVYPEKG